jgi:ATP-dependent helicase/nuclease subunit B
VLDPAGAAVVYSVTELEKAAECPFRFFVKRGLGIRPVDDRERDRDVWLDPLTRGSALHDVYAAYLRKVRDEQRTPSKEDEEWIAQYAQQLLDGLHEEMPAPTEEVLARESRDFLADVALFLEAELADTKRRAIGLEVSFGRPIDEAEEALASAEPATIMLAPGITLRFAGRIDRINEVGPSTFEVLDYKTGGYFRDDWKGIFNGGKRLQHALYGLAVVGLLKGKYERPNVKGGSYYFSSTKGGGHRVDIAAPSTNAIAKVLTDLREVISGGRFLRTANQKNCKQAEAKLADPEANAFVRLGAHA